MKKVAHFIDSPDPGGAETLVVEICRNLEHHGFIPEVFHFGNAWLQEKCRENNIVSVIVPGYRYYKSFKTIPFFTLAFMRFLKQRDVDILHSHLFGSTTGGCFAAFLSNLPHVGTLHDTYTIEEKKARIRLLQLASIFKTRLVTVSQQMRDYLMTSGRFPRGSLQIILNGVSLDKFSEPADTKLMTDIGIQHDDFVLICVGRLEKIKGHDVLIEAFSRLKSKKIKLLIAGEGSARKNLEALIRKKGLKHNVKLLGQREDVPKLLKLAHCFVLASHSEGLSCSIIEAMAAGLPVVATNVGGNYELVNNGVNGYLSLPNDPNAFAERLHILINDDEKRQKFGKNSSKIAYDKFSLDKMIAEYISVYRELLHTT